MKDKYLSQASESLEFAERSKCVPSEERVRPQRVRGTVRDVEGAIREERGASGERAQRSHN